MSNLFRKPEVSAPSTPPPAPNMGNSQIEQDVAAREVAQRLNRGRTSTMLTGGGGVGSLGSTSKVLLGR